MLPYQLLSHRLSSNSQTILGTFLLRKAFEAGLMNLEIPQNYGGQGLGLVDQAVVVEEISAACPGIATSTFDNSLGLEPILLSRNEQMKQKIFS